jgi:uncharacterized protein YacL
MMIGKKKITQTKKRSKKITRSEILDVVEIPHEERLGRGNIARTAVQGILLPPKVVAQIADQVAKAVSQRVPRRTSRRKIVTEAKSGFVLDTSAIIDGRIFDLAKIGAFFGNFIVIAGVLDELKNIADSKDDVKKERVRKALRNLDEFKKMKGIKLIHVSDLDTKIPVDERVISYAKKNEGRILTCDYNLSKKARITGAVSIDLYEMANILKTTAVPGEEFFVKVVQRGKGAGQGVGYLPDGTMIVVEQGENLLEKTVKVVVSRVIQTDAGRIFFGKIVS